MIYAIYLLKTILAMSVFLLLYRLFLEKEKMHNFNRFYLLGSILFSLLVPFLPTGIALSSLEPSTIVESVSVSKPILTFSMIGDSERSWFTIINAVLLLYLLGLSYFSLKFANNFYQMIKKIINSEISKYQKAKIVLLDDCDSPFTFLNYIFLKKEDFESNNIDQQLLEHELTHALHKHTWDVIFIEFVMLIFWFNPILRWYKTAIQLNHEFIADDSVVEKYNEVKTYQYLLLDTIQNKQKIYLASNINFHLTQKRLKMMTKKSSSVRKKMLIFSILPIAILLLMGLGSPINAQSQGTKTKGEVSEKQNTFKDRYFEHTVVQYETKNGEMKMIKYSSLNDDIKSKIFPPPPPPPVISGSGQKNKMIEPLPKGTVVYLSKKGGIFIGDKQTGDMRPPPPPPVTATPPPAPKVSKSVGLMVPPPPPPVPAAPKPVAGQPVPPVAAPAPPVPPTLIELVKDGARIYINGKMATEKEIQELNRMNTDIIERINVKMEKDGKKSVYIVKK